MAKTLILNTFIQGVGLLYYLGFHFTAGGHLRHPWRFTPDTLYSTAEVFYEWRGLAGPHTDIAQVKIAFWCLTDGNSGSDEYLSGQLKETMMKMGTFQQSENKN